MLLTLRFFTKKRVVSHASALTYSTLLAIVPILAVIFAIARGFGYNKYIELWFRDSLASQPQVADVIVGFVNSYLVHTKSGIFLGVGLIIMLYTVLLLVSNIELTFNEIWQVKKSRSFFRTFTDYLAMLLCLPIILVVMSGITLWFGGVAPIVPYILLCALFTAVYVIVPNTHVRIASAIVPGIITGCAIQVLQMAYVHSQLWVSSYNAIYGSFAALPLFMLWLQISWTIILFGATLCYSNQNLSYYDLDTTTEDISHRYVLLLSTILAATICRRFELGQKALTATELRDATGIPIRIVSDLLYRMIECGVLIEVTNDEKGTPATFLPAESIENLSVGTLVNRLESNGTWRLSISVTDSKAWRNVIAIRHDYLTRSRTILLKDLAPTD